jgi:hypothetical protein
MSIRQPVGARRGSVRRSPRPDDASIVADVRESHRSVCRGERATEGGREVCSLQRGSSLGITNSRPGSRHLFGWGARQPWRWMGPVGSKTRANDSCGPIAAPSGSRRFGRQLAHLVADSQMRGFCVGDPVGKEVPAMEQPPATLRHERRHQPYTPVRTGSPRPTMSSGRSCSWVRMS